ncbi:ORF6N domain-containing protein [Bacteroides acidifaciens]|uniref:ORF6N domain-containing protein n=1 Tax=Bacteroides acidifaciens TaxID=85831 RepID=UPI002675FB08|nr:ORF6N domain-containing protein [Bacteroides acidifaciens]
MNQLQTIQSKIYEIRGQRVMLDFDLAELYGIETKYLKRSVKNNIRRFPSDFMFELTKEEFDSLRCNFSTSKRGGIRYMPFAFSEHGVAQLSAVLNSDIAIEVNIQIIRTFVAMRQWITTPPIDKNAELREEMKKLKEYMEEVFADQNDINEDTRIQLELINQTLAELQVRNKEHEKAPRPRIGFIRYDE